MIMLTGIRLLIFATIVVVSATWLCYDTMIDGNQYLAVIAGAIALVGGKEMMEYKTLKNGDK